MDTPLPRVQGARPRCLIPSKNPGLRSRERNGWEQTHQEVAIRGMLIADDEGEKGNALCQGISHPVRVPAERVGAARLQRAWIISATQEPQNVKKIGRNNNPHQGIYQPAECRQQCKAPIYWLENDVERCE